MRQVLTGRRHLWNDYISWPGDSVSKGNHGDGHEDWTRDLCEGASQQSLWVCSLTIMCAVQFDTKQKFALANRPEKVVWAVRKGTEFSVFLGLDHPRTNEAYKINPNFPCLSLPKTFKMHGVILPVRLIARSQSAMSNIPGA